MTLLLLLLACGETLDTADTNEDFSVEDAQEAARCDAENRAFIREVGFPGLDSAFAAAASGDTVRLCSGTHQASLTVRHDVSLVGLGDGPEQVRWAPADGRHLTVEAGDVLLAGLSLVDGWHDQGGAIEVAAGASLSAVDVSFTDNTASHGGGGAICAFGALVLRDVTFADNQAGGRGGAIYASGPLLSLSGVHLETNVALSEGGAVASASESVLVEGGTFLRNESVGDGGAMYLLAGATSELSLADVVLLENESDADGGALFLDGERWEASLTDVVFDQNAADTGGALAVAAETAAVLEHAGGEVLRNTSHAVALSEHSELSSWEANWGEGDADNYPADVAGGFSAGEDAVFSCVGSECAETL